MDNESALLDRTGRLFIPAKIRKEMGWNPGDRLVLSPMQRELRVLSRRQAIEQIRAEVLKHVKPGVSLVEGLIRDRREEVRREEEDYRRSIARRKIRMSSRKRSSRG
jgi:AbrB family looped-hinge helix DNA binding protein